MRGIGSSQSQSQEAATFYRAPRWDLMFARTLEFLRTGAMFGDFSPVTDLPTCCPSLNKGTFQTASQKPGTARSKLLTSWLLVLPSSLRSNIITGLKPMIKNCMSYSMNKNYKSAPLLRPMTGLQGGRLKSLSTPGG